MKIYKITNNVNGKVYIGQTSSSLEARWRGHRSSAKNKWETSGFKKAIEQFGEENFSIEQIDTAATKEEANAKEAYWIERYNSVVDGYNTSRGGSGKGCGKKVVNVERGDVFNSLSEAAESVGVSAEAVRQAIKYQWKVGGFHWKLHK